MNNASKTVILKDTSQCVIQAHFFWGGEFPPKLRIPPKKKLEAWFVTEQLHKAIVLWDNSFRRIIHMLLERKC